MFNAGMLSTEEEMHQFSENFAVEMHLIKTYKYIAHLEDLKQQSSIFKRTRGRKEQKHKLASKTFKEYAWHHLVESGDSQKLLDDQWEDINESADEEAKEGGMEDDGKEIDGSGD
ncbi:unnamed protein product [Porites lobata]|uniref:Uncharacterized protein n=1 Tax=Porites lobata TaxID=104759 RepID=A0ABN8PHD6_9CNID|nr:unnamed protein product [Porites lobata]